MGLIAKITNLWRDAGAFVELIITKPINFAAYKAIALCCDNGATLPTSPTPQTGQWFLHTTSGRSVLCQYIGSWVPIYSFASFTVYVDGALGTDSQNGGTASGASAFRTISFALAQVPGLNAGNVVINVAAGTYSESVTVQGKNFVGPYTITIRGADINTQTPTVASTTPTSYTKGNANGSSPTPGTIVKTGAFTGLSLRGYFVQINGSGAYYPIVDNTNDQIRFSSNVPTSVTTFAVYPPPPTILSHASGHFIAAGQTALTFESIRFNTAAAITTWTAQLGSVTTMLYCYTQGGNTANGTLVQNGRVDYTNSYMEQTNSSKFGVTTTYGVIVFSQSALYIGGTSASGVRANQNGFVSGSHASCFWGTGGQIGWNIVGGAATVFGGWYYNLGTGVSCDIAGEAVFQTSTFATFDTCTNHVVKPLAVQNSTLGMFTNNITQRFRLGYDTAGDYDDLSYGGSANQDITINDQHEVGIGREASGYKVHVGGTNPELILQDATGGGSPKIGTTTSYGFGTEGFKFYYSGSSGHTFFDSYYSLGGYRFRTQCASTPFEIIRIDKDGKTGLNLGGGDPQAQLDVYGTARFGDSTTNYSDFEADGTLHFTGNATVWKKQSAKFKEWKDDPTYPLTTVQGFAGFGNMVVESFDYEEGVQYCHFCLPLPADWKEGTPVHFFVNYSPLDSLESGDYSVVFGMEYAWGDPATSRFDQDTGTINLTDTVGSLTQYEDRYTDTKSIAPQNAQTINSKIMCTLWRDTGSDDADVDLALMEVGFWYECDTVGARTMGSK